MRNALRRILAAGAVAAALLPYAAIAHDADTPWWHPDGLLLQAGVGKHVQSAAASLVWDTDWRRDYASGLLTAYVEADIGKWHTSARVHNRTFTQVGVTPMLRFYPRPIGSGWFVEAGIGANAISPLYRDDDKRFSTVFNFGDRLGVGRRFGERDEHEITLRVEHFSNCRIKQPNPGENFIQMRYSRRF